MDKNALISSFQRQRTSQKYKNDSERIRASEYELSMLLEQRSVLETSLNEINQQIKEEKEQEKHSQKSKGPTPGLFFRILTQLEDKETEIETQIAQQKKAIANLSHTQNAELIKTRRVVALAAQEKERIENAEMDARISRDKLEDLCYELEQMEYEYKEACERATSIEKALETRKENISHSNEGVFESLSKRKEEALSDLSEVEKYESESVNKLKELEKVIEKKQKEEKEAKYRENSAKEWRGERRLISSRAIATKKKLNSQLKSLETTKNREIDIETKFKKLLGDDDPGNGTGATARRMIQTEINRLESMPETEAMRELEIEREYNETLKIEMKSIEKSTEAFEKYKKLI